ncbi:MAG: hypothetical protein ACRC7B_02920 [Metamycoplasmataceae bacterium]
MENCEKNIKQLLWQARELISRVDTKEAKKMVDEVMLADNEEQVKVILKKYKF